MFTDAFLYRLQLSFAFLSGRLHLALNPLLQLGAVLLTHLTHLLNTLSLHSHHMQSTNRSDHKQYTSNYRVCQKK